MKLVRKSPDRFFFVCEVARKIAKAKLTKILAVRKVKHAMLQYLERKMYKSCRFLKIILILYWLDNVHCVLEEDIFKNVTDTKQRSLTRRRRRRRREKRFG